MFQLAEPLDYSGLLEMHTGSTDILVVLIECTITILTEGISIEYTTNQLAESITLLVY